MIEIIRNGVFVKNGREILERSDALACDASEKTMAFGIMRAHNNDKNDGLWHIKFDALASHDITYVGVIQTVRAAEKDFEKFPVPYALTNCHNSLCAVGGTTNSDDHAFGLSAAKKYGGIFVPPHIAVIHQYVREQLAAGGKMILGSDSHTRYGALGTMGIGEGGGELVKQILGRTYDIARPEVIGVMLSGEPRPGVGPQDVALALIGAVFEDGFVKNKVLEFFGAGVANLSMDFRMGVDVMTTETTCLSSIWETDSKTEEFFALHNRAQDYKKISPAEIAFYDGLIKINLSEVVPMIAMPHHPSNVFKIEEMDKNLKIDQGIIAGCAGGLYESICGAAQILRGKSLAFPVSVYPASQPMFLSLAENGIISDLMREGVIVKTAFCGPCFGAGDVPRNNGFSIRHVTRNFPNREGAKPNMNQNASVALMDALSIAATAANGGKLTAADKIISNVPKYFFDGKIYAKQIYNGVNAPEKNAELVYGPGIRDWPEFKPLAENMLLCVASVITDAVTTTDELIPSGETSTFRSNPYALAEHTLSRKDPEYVGRAKKIAACDEIFQTEKFKNIFSENIFSHEKFKNIFSQNNEKNFADTAVDFANAICVLRNNGHSVCEKTAVGSLVYARKPGDGSAREQAASCQRVLGGLANIAAEYATKRYRSNLINWGMIPFIFPDEPPFACEDFIFIPKIREKINSRAEKIPAFVVNKNGDVKNITLEISLTAAEADALLAGCLINLYSK
ncbi:MAG: aconitase family protein [Defluviitaleaceae bacterium]|nr:aconitase family protein [Defluviitaleaceae bacterium]